METELGFDNIMGYRIHIDIPLESDNEHDASLTAIQIINAVIDNSITASILKDLGVTQANYRLGHDDDRQKSNYLIKNDNGHTNNKKSKIRYVNKEQSTVDE